MAVSVQGHLLQPQNLLGRLHDFLLRPARPQKRREFEAADTAAPHEIPSSVEQEHEYLPSQAGGAVAAAPVLAPGEAFTPTQPRSGRRRLIGRRVELMRILQALREDQAHVVLYAERGRGKTSLANLVSEALRRTGSTVARHTCDADTTFDDLMRGLLRDLPASLLGAPTSVRPDRGLSTGDGIGCVEALPSGVLRPADVLALPQRLDCRDLVCVVDEFDRVLDTATRTRLADTIKQLSDRRLPLLFMIVGVSDTLEQILGQHPSIQRNVIGVHLPLFSDEEVGRLVVEGGRAAGLSFPEAAVNCVLWVSRGMPYMAQMLALRLAQAATARGDSIVSHADFQTAVDRLALAAPAHVSELYADLTLQETDAEMMLALRRIASAPQDQFGRMQVFGGQAGSVTVGGNRIPLTIWERLQARNVLQAVGAGSGLFTFLERGLMHHVLLLTAHDVVQGFVNDRPPMSNVLQASQPVPQYALQSQPDWHVSAIGPDRMSGDNQ